MIPDSYDPRQVGELFLVADAVLDTPATAAQIGPGEAAWQSTPCPLAPGWRHDREAAYVDSPPAPRHASLLQTARRRELDGRVRRPDKPAVTALE